MSHLFCTKSSRNCASTTNIICALSFAKPYRAHVKRDKKTKLVVRTHTHHALTWNCRGGWWACGSWSCRTASSSVPSRAAATLPAWYCKRPRSDAYRGPRWSRCCCASSFRTSPCTPLLQCKAFNTLLSLSLSLSLTPSQASLNFIERLRIIGIFFDVNVVWRLTRVMYI